MRKLAGVAATASAMIALLGGGSAAASPTLGTQELPSSGKETLAAHRAKDLGAHVLRVHTAWSSIEPTQQPNPASWNWAATDPWYDALKAQGIRPLILVVYSPSWAQNVLECTNTPRCPPGGSHMGEWQTFVSEVVKRYGVQTTPVNPHYADPVGVEIWNEPNIKTDWNTGGGPSPSRYATMLSSAYDAVKAARPDLPVYMGGLIDGADSAGNSISVETWMQDMATYGVLGKYDVLGFHAYPAGSPSDSVSTVLGRLETSMQRARDSLAAVGQSSKPIALTEIGIGDPQQVDNVKTTQAGDLLAAYYDTTAMQGVTEFYIYRLLQSSDTVNLGLVNNDSTLTPRAGFCGLKAAFNPGPYPGCP
jgi:hypothetical protein